MTISIRGLHAGYGREAAIINGLNLDLLAGEITILIGPNGCGKSTLLKTVGRLLKPRAGSIHVDDLNILETPPKRVARTIAYLPQDPIVPAAISVEQLVGYGRAPHQSLLGLKSVRDIENIDAAIETAGISHLRYKSVSELSGGQKQSAFFAMVLAQDTPYAILDEPTNHLDVTHQIAALELIKALNAQHEKTAIVVLHDLNLAARYADRLILMNKGQICADGDPVDVLTSENIANVFEVDGQIITDPVHGKPMCVPYPLAGATSSG